MDNKEASLVGYKALIAHRANTLINLAAVLAASGDADLLNAAEATLSTLIESAEKASGKKLFKKMESLGSVKIRKDDLKGCSEKLFDIKDKLESLEVLFTLQSYENEKGALGLAAIVKDIMKQIMGVQSIIQDEEDYLFGFASLFARD